MAIQLRRGLVNDFNSSKLKSGEFAVATDANMIGVAKSPDEFVELATKEDLSSVIGGSVEVRGKILVISHD